MSPSEQETLERRSANYAPSIWTDQFIQSRSNVYLDENYAEQAEKLKERVRGLLQKNKTLLLEQMELIDVLQRIGLSHHFTHEIGIILSALHQNHQEDDVTNPMSLYQTSSLFRLLRQEGYPIPQGVFKKFLDEGGEFDKRHIDDVRGILSLYEASYLGMEGEEILEEAKHFCIHNLKKWVDEQVMMTVEEEEVRHALEMPLHWGIERLEARWFIDIFEKRVAIDNSSTKSIKDDEKGRIIVELSKLDYNIVQALYLKDLKKVSSWAHDIRLAQVVGGFARSRLVEGMMWTVGVIPQPKYEYGRNILPKLSEFITMIDDVYDVYATLGEAQTLTRAIERWDVNTIEEEDLPTCVKVYLLGLFNYVNQIVYDVHLQLGINVLSYVKQSWVGLARAYLAEAEWYYGGHKPSLEEYLENGWVSSTAPIVLMGAYVVMAAAGRGTDNTERIVEDLQLLLDDQTIIRYCSVVVRLRDDLGTSSAEMKRGDVPKAVQCHMNDNPRCSEEEARAFICRLIEHNWRKINSWVVANVAAARPHFFPDFVSTVLNFARASQCIYQYGDGHAGQGAVVKQRICSLFFDPIPLPSSSSSSSSIII